MHLCLYHEEHGYYAQRPVQVGKAGDFFTSVSCGPLFGILIAEKIVAWWHHQHITGPWRIVEPGPNNAALALDILRHLRDHHAEAFRSLTYVTLDPLPVPRAYQADALAEFSAHVSCLADTASLTPLPSYVVANEVLDAFPCHQIEFDGTGWREIWIESAQDGHLLTETTRPLSRPLPQRLREVSYPAGYRTEIRDPYTPFLRDLQQSMSHGRMLWFDYGFASPEYYDPQRTLGTLRVYRQHQASENTLLNPGEADLTAHVDFTAFFAEAHLLDLKLACFEPQEFLLSRLMPLLLDQGTWQQNWQHNLQTLVHPAHLGGKFHAMELCWREQNENDATGLRRLAWEDPS